MEFRQLRRFKQAATSQECEAVLSSAQRGILSVHGENGYPYGLPVNYLYLNGKIYFHCAKAGHKLDAIRANDKVCFTVLSEPVKNPGEWWNCFTSVICFGHISEVADEQKKDRLLHQISVNCRFSPNCSGMMCPRKGSKGGYSASRAEIGRCGG